MSAILRLRKALTARRSATDWVFGGALAAAITWPWHFALGSWPAAAGVAALTGALATTPAPWRRPTLPEALRRDLLDAMARMRENQLWVDHEERKAFVVLDFLGGRRVLVLDEADLLKAEGEIVCPCFMVPTRRWGDIIRRTEGWVIGQERAAPGLLKAIRANTSAMRRGLLDPDPEELRNLADSLRRAERVDRDGHL